MSVPGSIPSAIPHLDDGQSIPFGDDNEFKIGRDENDGNLHIETANGELEITEQLDLIVPGNLVVDGDTTEVDDFVTGQITVEDGTGTQYMTFDALSTPPTATFDAVVDMVGSEVNITNADLDLNFGDITRLGDITGGQTVNIDATGGSGTAVTLGDTVAGIDILVANATGNVDIPNGSVTISGFEINEFSDLVADDRYLNLRTYGSGDGAIELQDSSQSNEVMLAANEGGPVDVPNRQLHEQGSRVSTRTWVSNNFNNYTDDEARSAVSGATLSGLTYTSTVTFQNSTNDFWRINDASGGSNTSPHTARFDGRDFRFYAGSGVGSVVVMRQGGNVEVGGGDLLVSGTVTEGAAV